MFAGGNSKLIELNELFSESRITHKEMHFTIPLPPSDVRDTDYLASHLNRRAQINAQLSNAYFLYRKQNNKEIYFVCDKEKSFSLNDYLLSIEEAITSIRLFKMTDCVKPITCKVLMIFTITDSKKCRFLFNFLKKLKVKHVELSANLDNRQVKFLCDDPENWRNHLELAKRELCVLQSKMIEAASLKTNNQLTKKRPRPQVDTGYSLTEKMRSNLQDINFAKLFKQEYMQIIPDKSNVTLIIHIQTQSLFSSTEIMNTLHKAFNHPSFLKELEIADIHLFFDFRKPALRFQFNDPDTWQIDWSLLLQKFANMFSIKKMNVLFEKSTASMTEEHKAIIEMLKLFDEESEESTKEASKRPKLRESNNEEHVILQAHEIMIGALLGDDFLNPNRGPANILLRMLKMTEKHGDQQRETTTDAVQRPSLRTNLFAPIPRVAHASSGYVLKWPVNPVNTVLVDISDRNKSAFKSS